MGRKEILVDTSVFIDYYRKQNKENALLTQLSKEYDIFISVITKFEILAGVKNEVEKEFWDSVFDSLFILPFGNNEAEKSAEIYAFLRKANQIIGVQDIFIAATALTNLLQISTLNKKDFERIKKLEIL
ncbi:MAG: type II toxin-antitoxin system VapC family toxin [Paludibacter sp.]|jgi:predicted nucleic acid-binding protein|nr:type II toxin-antitoxin system VapC family toxin [Paludibacter sp.]